MIYCESDCRWSVDGICRMEGVTIVQFADQTPECEDYEVIEEWE